MGDSGDRVMGGEDAMMGAMMGPLHWNIQATEGVRAYPSEYRLNICD